MYLPPLGHVDPNHLREEKLPLHRRALHRLQRREEERASETVKARIDLAQTLLFRGGLNLFDNATEASLTVTQDPPVARRVRYAGGEEGRYGSRRAVGIKELSHRFVGEERGIARQDQDGPGKALERRLS